MYSSYTKWYYVYQIVSSISICICARWSSLLPILTIECSVVKFLTDLDYQKPRYSYVPSSLMVFKISNNKIKMFALSVHLKCHMKTFFVGKQYLLEGLKITSKHYQARAKRGLFTN